MKKKILLIILTLLLLLPMSAFATDVAPKLAVPIAPREGVRITSEYGYRIHPITKKQSFHSGVDIAAPLGTYIYSIAYGKVIMAKPNGLAGNEIRIDHGNGVISRYLHMYQRNVNVGDIVKPGQVIGTVGSTGNSTGYHLHFEMLKNNKSINPINIILGRF